MVFYCMTCGKELVSHYVHSPRLFCSKQCNNMAQRKKLFTVEERQNELKRRKKAIADAEPKVTCEKSDVVCTDTGGIIVKCIVCGKDMEQRTGSARLYCSNDCRNEQRRTHKVPEFVLAKETQKRRAMYYAALTPERKKELEYGKIKRGEFKEREAKRLGFGDEPRPNRYCHNFPKCKNLTWDYYCPDCRRKNRQGYVEQDYEETEDVWDDFSVPGSVE